MTLLNVDMPGKVQASRPASRGYEREITSLRAENGMLRRALAQARRAQTQRPATEQRSTAEAAPARRSQRNSPVQRLGKPRSSGRSLNEEQEKPPPWRGAEAFRDVVSIPGVAIFGIFAG